MSEERAATALDKRIGARLRARRLEVGMSQEALAEILGVTFQQVQKYEKGTNRIAASRLFDISVALDVPVGSFFETAGPSSDKREDVRLKRALATSDAVEVVLTFASIPTKTVRRRVLELVRAMASGGGR